MRTDFILPAVLFIALMAMVVYATTGGHSADAGAQQLATTPATCQPSGSLVKLPDLPEASGLAASERHRDLFWAHNDSSEPTIYAIGADGALRGRVRVAGAAVEDWEAITVAPCDGGSCVFIGDIGDNNLARRSIRVFRVPEPSPDDEATAPATVLEGTYPEGPQDAEGVFLANKSLYVVTKGDNAPVRIYRFPSLASAEPQQLQLVATVSSSEVGRDGRITDADVSPDGSWIALRTLESVLFYRSESLLNGRVDQPLAYDVSALNEPQGEGLAWADPSTLFLAGEGEGGGTFARISCNLPS